MPTHRETAEKNMTKSEFKLFTQSFPRALKRLSEEKAVKALSQTEQLVAKYRRSLARASEDQIRLINYRLRTLENTLERYSKKLNVGAKMKVRKEKRSMTAQPKMLVSLKDGPRENFLFKEKEKIYARATREPRQRNSAIQAVTDRISGSVKSQTRKGQIGRDRKKAAREAEG